MVRLNFCELAVKFNFDFDLVFRFLKIDNLNLRQAKEHSNCVEQSVIFFIIIITKQEKIFEVTVGDGAGAADILRDDFAFSIFSKGETN